MIFLNDEDMDITAIVGRWLSKQSANNNLEGWIEDYFYQALAWFASSVISLVLLFEDCKCCF